MAKGKPELPEDKKQTPVELFAQLRVAIRMKVKSGMQTHEAQDIQVLLLDTVDELDEALKD